MHHLLKSTWALPILFAVLSLLGLIGALVYEGAIDKIFVGCLSLALIPILLKLIK